MGGDDTSVEMALAQSLNDAMEVSTARSWESIAEVSDGAVKAVASGATGVAPEGQAGPSIDDDDFEKLLFDGVDDAEEIDFSDVMTESSCSMDEEDDATLDFISQYEASVGDEDDDLITLEDVA
jgi:hypothetical protein